MGDNDTENAGVCSTTQDDETYATKAEVVNPNMWVVADSPRQTIGLYLFYNSPVIIDRIVADVRPYIPSHVLRGLAKTRSALIKLLLREFASTGRISIENRSVTLNTSPKLIFRRLVIALNNNKHVEITTGLLCDNALHDVKKHVLTSYLSLLHNSGIIRKVRHGVYMVESEISSSVTSSQLSNQRRLKMRRYTDTGDDE